METNTSPRDFVVQRLIELMDEKDHKLLASEYAGPEEGDRDIMNGDISPELAAKIKVSSELLGVHTNVVEWELIRTIQSEPQED